MSDEEKPPGLSSKDNEDDDDDDDDEDDDKGIIVVGEDDDQTGRITEPGPAPGDDSYSALGPLMCFCFSKPLTSPEVNPKSPILFLDAYETSMLLNAPDIIASPNSFTFPKKLHVYDVRHKLYMMRLSPCDRLGWSGYSLTTGWNHFVRHNRLAADDVVSFHRSRDIFSFHRAYNYVITKESDKLEVFTRFRAEDYVKNEPKGPGSRYMKGVSRCLSKTLTSDDVDEQNPRLSLTAMEVFRLTCRGEILDKVPGRFSEDLVVFDQCDNQYRMNISNQDTGSLTSFVVNTEWGIYAQDFDLKEGDVLEIYRFIDHKLVPGRFYYAFKLFRKPLPAPSDLDEEYSALARTLTRRDVGSGKCVLYIDASEAYSLTNCDKLKEPSPPSMMLSVYDEDDNDYDMMLSYCTDNVFAISRGWARFVRDHQMRAGDRVLFYRFISGVDNVEPYYEIKFIKKEELEMTQQANSPDRKRKAGPGSRGIPDPETTLTKVLTAHHGNIVWMCFDADEAWFLTGCPKILENLPYCTVLMNLVVYDEEERPYDMVLTHTKRADGIEVCTLDGGWHRLVATNGLKAGDNVTISRIQDEPYYVLSYTRAVGLRIGSGASGVGPSGVGGSGSGAEPIGSGLEEA